MSQQQQGECTKNGVNSIPRGWCWAKIENVIELCQYGSSAKTTEDGNGVPVLRMGNIQDGNLDLTDLKYLPSDHDEFPRLLLQEGDLLFNRTNSAELVGKSAVYGGFPFPCSYASYLVALRFGPSCLSKYVCFYLNSRYGRSWVRSVVSQQVGQANVNSTKLRSLGFPLAPIREQRRIVAKIEELFSDLDAGVAALERVRANLKRYRAAVLKATVEGKLTEDWRAQHPDTEPASVLLERILTERRRQWEQDQLAKFVGARKQPPAGWQEKYPEPVEPEINPAYELPRGWGWASLSQIGELDRGRSRHRPRNAPHLYGGPYPFIQTGDIRHARTFVREHTQKYSEAGLEQSRLWKAGTLCITIAANIAETAILGFDACFPDSVVGFLSDVSHISVRYIELYMRTVQSRLESIAPATAQKNINLEVLKSLPVILPPRGEQQEIVSEVERRLSIVDEIEAQVDANLKRAARLRQGILKRAFEGRLVPQDPSDEPAEKLLERIRQQRQLGPTPTNGRPRSRPRRRRRDRGTALPLFDRDNRNEAG